MNKKKTIYLLENMGFAIFRELFSSVTSSGRIYTDNALKYASIPISFRMKVL